MTRRAFDRENEGGRPCVVNEELFEQVVIRERKRAERSNQPFVLLLVNVNDAAGADPSRISEAVVEALTTVTRKTEVLGWLERRAVIGVILSGVRASELTHARQEVADRVRGHLTKRMDPATAGRISLQFHVYPEPRPAGEGRLWAVDPSLYPELPLGRRRGLYGAMKRVLDISGSLILLVVLSPLLLLIAALVKMGSRGPVLFKQVRVGQMMKPFTILKFRTMHLNADHALHKEFVSRFIKSTGELQEPKPVVFKLVNDPRVSPVGRVLRKTSLDELPQLWNVLRGEMSLVGPRPPIPYELEQYQPWHRRRVIEAKPGITGLWQVRGRSRTTFDEMVRLDLRYSRTCSLWTDLTILLATPAAVIAGKGAC